MNRWLVPWRRREEQPPVGCGLVEVGMQALARQISCRLPSHSRQARALGCSQNLLLSFNQNITFAANRIWRSRPVPVPRPARFSVEVITPKVAVLVTSVPGLLRCGVLVTPNISIRI